MLFSLLPVYAKEVDNQERTTHITPLVGVKTQEYPFYKPVQNIVMPLINEEESIITVSEALIGNKQCIDYIKYKINYYEEKLVNPKNFWSNYEEFGFKRLDYAERGSVLITSEGPVWHVSFIEKVEGDNIYISEQNYKYRQYSERILNKNDEKIIGFLKY